MMKNPVHPARILQDIQIRYDLTLEQFAKMLDISAKSLSNFFIKQTRIKPSLAYRLEMAGIFNASFLLSAQSNYDLAQYIHKKTKEPNVDVGKFKKMQQEITARFEKKERELEALYGQLKKD